MSARKEVETSTYEIAKAIKGAKVATIEVVEEDGYIVVGFDNGATLYADDPTLYVDAEEHDENCWIACPHEHPNHTAEIGNRVVITTRLNSGRYIGRKGKILSFGGEKAAIRMDEFTPGLDAPDGVVYLYANEYRREDA
jgi:hypothetical protein